MAKQALLGALEDVIGEYVLNLDKDSLKIQAIRGKIKMENVQLDGDFLGGRILGSMGLSGFGILSCWAKTFQITVPLKNIEKEPTRIEIKGIHLLCLPLLPSTANKMFGAGTAKDPRCTLRTRAKRSKLARYENNFKSGRIPGEGPVAQRILRAARDVEKDHKKKKKKQSTDNSAKDSESSEAFLEYLVSDLAGDTESSDYSTNDNVEENSSKDPSFVNGQQAELFELPRNWKVKLREKILRNVEAKLLDIHVRCEVSEGGLDFGVPDHLKTFRGERKDEKGLKYDQRAFTFGGTLDNFKIRTANEKWQVGSHEKTKQTDDEDHLGPNGYDARNNKVISWENCSMYWDDDPPFLISETDIIQSTDHKISADRFHGKIANAMEALYAQQEPGQKIRESLQGRKRASRTNRRNLHQRPHQYCFENFNYQVRQRMSDRTQPGLISCQAEFLAFQWDWKMRPSQFVQYQKLKSAMLSQRRFDTMLRQRPSRTPLNNPREWWKYAFGCITTRPNSRPWIDILRISRNRNRYVELVLKKLACRQPGTGFHAGLVESDSSELLALEDLLPIEALLAFHLVALRKYYSETPEMAIGGEKGKADGRGRSMVKTKIKRIFRSRSKSSRDLKGKEPLSSLPATQKTQKSAIPTIPSSTAASTSLAILDAMKLRLGNKQWRTRLKFLQARLTITLLSASDIEIVKLITEGGGSIQLLGPGKQDCFFDISQFEVVDCQGNSNKILFVKAAEENFPDDVSSDLSDTTDLAILGIKSAISFIDLPPTGVLCRLAATKNSASKRFSFSAHPATLIWTRPCFDALAEFFGAPSTKMKTELTRHLKNVSTPLARKAQLAFLSQSNFQFHINVAAPKVWVPFSAKVSDGSLLLDAGNFRMACTKEDQKTNIDWNLDATDIQINYATWRLSEVRERISSALLFPPGQQMTSIIRPFQVHAVSGLKELHGEAGTLVGDHGKYSGPIISLDISISPICLNLVDAEVLARAIGKWYSQGIIAVRGRAASRNVKPGKPNSIDESLAKPTTEIDGTQHSLPHSLSFTIGKIEMALEGHSKVNISDEKSIESHDTSILGEAVWHTRTYVVELFQITVQKFRHNQITSTKLLVADASIVQVKDSSDYMPMMDRHEAVESQYCILERRIQRKDPGPDQTSLRLVHDGIAPRVYQTGTEILKASMFHDRRVHLDEVEVDIESVILRVTPTSLKDCMKGIRNIFELIQLMTREMERKVHEEGRKARQRDSNVLDLEQITQDNSRPVSPTFSIASDLTDPKSEVEFMKSPSDSSLLFKVTIRDGTLLAGRPTTSKQKFGNKRLPRLSRQSYSFAVVHVMSNALIMFQSIENPDTSGSKTLHISLDNLSASVNTAFDYNPASHSSPMIGPTGAEFRVMNSTEQQGVVVSHDVSLDCEHLKSCLTPNDLTILLSIVNVMIKRLRGEQDSSQSPNERSSKRNDSKAAVSSLVKYQKRGTGIATNIRIEFQTFSFVVLRAFQSKYGAPEFLAFKLKELKAKLGGCISALSGECSAGISIDFYNAEVSAWEYAVEPFQINIAVDQMPNELILNASTPIPIQLNLTGILLRDIAELDFRSLREEESKDTPHALTPSALSTVGLRRATESHTVIIHNFSGLDVEINPTGSLRKSRGPGRSVRFDSVGPGLIKDSCCASIDSIFDIAGFQSDLEETAAAIRLSLQLTPSSIDIVGEREILAGLPISSSFGDSLFVHTLKPVVRDSLKGASGSGRSGVETVTDYAYHNAEPVVEWCMQNQRLRSSTVDLYSLEKGRDLLSASIWSPEEDYNIDSLTQLQGQDTALEKSNILSSPGRKSKAVAHHKSEWLRPYLKNDSPEWTDMTCILRMARERVMLPDSNWIWVNNWTVDVSGDFSESTDADGWEYQADFETFTRTRRFYNSGDCCRRRRWTRTRIVKPPKLDDPKRLLKIVWETSRDGKGNFKVVVKSHVTIHNSTALRLSFFVYSPSWDEEKLVGVAEPGNKIHVPVALASALYLRLAKDISGNSSTSVKDFVTSNRVMILPTSYNSSVWIRTCMHLGDVSETNLHFILKLICKKGIVDIFVEPVLRVINLLPCHLECQFGEVLRPSETRQADSRLSLPKGKKKRIANVETLSVASGKEGKCSALDPASKPHISLRVPGYKWSCWQRIINRKIDTYTWRPDEGEEELYLNWNKGDVDQAEEFRMIVQFDRLGAIRDPLVLILSVECSHSPTVRVYAQHWIVDKTGFGCRFCESFTDLMGTSPDVKCSRRSHLLNEDACNPSVKRDMNIQGHQWSIGMSGMTLYFSRREKIALSIESGAGDNAYSNVAKKSKWTSPIDISNVIPKTVLSVDEQGGPRRFEVAISVSVCPGVFSRTKMITLMPRYQIVNLLKREIVIAQDGCMKAATLIPSQSSVPYHWERQTLSPKVRLGAPSTEEKDTLEFNECWTNGCIQLDKIGITSMRLPTSGMLPVKPMVVQAEVRLATKEQTSAVVIVIWSTNENSNPLYVLRNRTPNTIICRQPLQAEETEIPKKQEALTLGSKSSGNIFECGTEFSPIVMSILGLHRLEEFVWVLREGDVMCFGFDDPEKPHILEWMSVDDENPYFDERDKKAVVEVDAMGSSSSLIVGGGEEIQCQIGAELSTKVIEFSLHNSSSKYNRSHLGKDIKWIEDEGRAEREEEEVSYSLRLEVPTLCVSFIDNVDPKRYGREILMAQFDHLNASFSQSREGYYEMELRLMNLQIDNHVPSSIHPVLVFCPKNNDSEPFLHMSAVRRLQDHSFTYVFRYAAFRMLEVNLFLDRRTAETIARYIEPVRKATEVDNSDETPHWVSNLTIGMSMKYSYPDRRAPRDIELLTHTANSGRIYFEQLHLHPVRIALTFTQEWTELNEAESIMVFQFIRGMTSIADAPLTFTSFVVAHVFESPQTLARVILTHYSSQLTKQIFAILGSLAILGVPADFISNVGTGVRDFFYEPIQGAVHGPRQFIEGLEAGTQSLARGVFVGVVRGAANVTEVVNSNLAGLTADDDFLDERKAYQRMLTDAMSRGITSRTFYDSLFLAGASVARGVKSGAYGIVDQPTRYASKFGPVGFMKGVGKAMVGALVKPVVGVGDAATLLMNHVSDATSKKQIYHKIPKRLRRALPSSHSRKPNCISLQPYDDRAAKAQKIVTGGESVDDVYIGHVNIPTHLIIASEQCLWAIDKGSREPWCVTWEEISHFKITAAGMRIAIFSQSGLKTYLFATEDEQECAELQRLMSMQLSKTDNASSNLAKLRSSSGNEELDILLTKIPGIKTSQSKHVFGSCNEVKKRLANNIKDEIDLIEQCFGRVKQLSSGSHKYFEKIDVEAWNLVSCWGQVFSGLSSRRCIAAAFINGTGEDIQIKSTKLVEGGSPCYSLPTQEFDPDQGLLHPGGVILFFGWGVVPSLLQPGNVFMHIETNAFIADLADQKSRDTYAEAISGYQIGFLEKSYDDAGWWAKYWLILLRDDNGVADR